MGQPSQRERSDRSVAAALCTILANQHIVKVVRPTRRRTNGMRTPVLALAWRA